MFRAAPVQVATMAIFLCLPRIASAAEWGDLTLRIVYDDEPPKPKLIFADKDLAVCRAGKLVDESVLVNVEDRGVANVVMWLEETGSKSELPIHPDYEKTAKAEIALSVKDCRFEPHVVLVQRSQSLVLKVQDPITCHFRGELPDGPLDVILPAGGIHKEAFTKADPVPGPIDCTIHPWLRGILFVHDNPYMAVSDASGRIDLANLPVGKWQFRMMHERCGFIRKATLGGKLVESRLGRIELDIKPGQNGLGDLLIKPAQFKE